MTTRRRKEATRARASSARSGRWPNPTWTKYADEDLLDVRFCDLGLRIARTSLEGRIEQLYDELERRDLRFRPHCWLSEEWFSPDGTPGFAIPFYLAHPRLAQLEYRQMFDVEGGVEDDCMRLFRHETGHAIDSAFRLRRRKRWQQLFGKHTKPYPDSYRANPCSRNHVLHLDLWYAQSHPTEDFAETFAVWLRSASDWRRQYAGWPALRKLEYVDELMSDITGALPPVRSRKQIEPLSQNRRTLRQHYRAKRARYHGDLLEMYDRDLLRLFTPPNTNGRARRSAAAFLGRIRGEILEAVAHGTGEHPYTIEQILNEMIVRCRELNLRLAQPEPEAKLAVAAVLSVETMNCVHSGQHRVPL